MNQDKPLIGSELNPLPQNNVRAYRLRMKPPLSQEELAFEAGVSVSTIEEVETGSMSDLERRMTLVFVRRVAMALLGTVDEVFPPLHFEVPAAEFERSRMAAEVRLARHERTPAVRAGRNLGATDEWAGPGWATPMPGEPEAYATLRRMSPDLVGRAPCVGPDNHVAVDQPAVPIESAQGGQHRVGGSPDGHD